MVVCVGGSIQYILFRNILNIQGYLRTVIFLTVLQINKSLQYENNSSLVFGWHFSPLCYFSICSSKRELFVGLSNPSVKVVIETPTPKAEQDSHDSRSSNCFLMLLWVGVSLVACQQWALWWGTAKGWYAFTWGSIKSGERDIRQKRKPDLCWGHVQMRIFFFKIN